MRYSFTKENDKTPFDDLIASVLRRMDTTDEFSDEYPMLLAYLERLNEIKAQNRRAPVSLDTLAIIAGNLFGILVVVGYEHTHAITSKGLNQLIRPKSI